MRIDKIVNEAPQRVAIIFGRFNPPHYGHKAAWATASKFDQWFVGTNKTTIGEKDPLPYEVKIEAMKAVWPEVANHIMTEQSWFTMASRVYEQLGPVVLIVVTDETDKDWIMPAMVKNNGVEGQHGFYNFPKIVWQKAARISSATDLRGAVAKGDKAAFEKAAGVSADTPVAGSTFYEVVSKYLMPYLNAKAEKERIKAERDAAKAAKMKPKKESVTEVAPPDMEDWIKDRKADFKKRYGDRWQEVLYATAWKQKKNESVAEGAPIVVAQAPIDVRNPKKAPQPYRNQSDIVPDTKPPSTEKRGVKGRPGQRPMPEYDVAEGDHDLEEGWREKAAAAALAGAAALGGGNAQAQNIDIGKVVHGALGHIGKMSNNPDWNKSVAVDAAQKALNQGIQQQMQKERVADQELIRQITDQTDRQRFAIAARDKDNWKHAAINMRTGMDVAKASAAVAYYNEIKQEMISKYSSQAEGVDGKVAGRHDPEDFDAMISRVGKLAKSGPLKTVWDPEKRVYKNVPVKQDKEVDEASLTTMRKYYAGDTDARDQTKLAQMRDFFNKHKDDFSDGIQRKEFNSMSSYQQWLERQGMKKISGKDNG